MINQDNAQQVGSKVGDVMAAATSGFVIAGTIQQWLPWVVSVVAGICTIAYTLACLYYRIRDERAKKPPQV